MDLQAHPTVRTVALFDLDGTITDADTMVEFLYLVKGRMHTWSLLASVLPVWCLSKFRLTDRDAPKRALLRSAFGGQEVTALQVLAERFTHECMPTLVRPMALECIDRHQGQGHQVVVVTASCSLWVSPWCALQGIECIATELGEQEGVFSGRLATPNCKGIEKVRRIRALLGDIAALEIHAYGDTPDDRPMLGLAQEAHYKPFR